jgi:hypothetical protein
MYNPNVGSSTSKAYNRNSPSQSGSHLGFPIGIKNIKFVENLPMIIPGQFGFNCPSGFREEAF